MKNTIIFIHGMFQNAKSWDKWVAYFTEKGYNCIAESWPLHEGDPADLRRNMPEKLGELRLAEVINKFHKLVTAQPEPPILIGHSVGGLIAQILVNNNLAKLAIPICSVAPNAMITFDWGFFKNSALITNPLKGDDPFIMDLESFHDSFCNTMSMDETKEAYEVSATHDSRNVLRDCLGDHGKVDVDLPHVPMLFVSAAEDQIIPPGLNEKNVKAYNDELSYTAFKEFASRGHYICGQPGWEEVVDHIYNWMQEKERISPYKTS